MNVSCTIEVVTFVSALNERPGILDVDVALGGEAKILLRKADHGRIDLNHVGDDSTPAQDPRQRACSQAYLEQVPGFRPQESDRLEEVNERKSRGMVLA